MRRVRRSASDRSTVHKYAAYPPHRLVRCCRDEDAHAVPAQVVVLRNRRAVRRFLAGVAPPSSATARLAAAVEERG